MLIRDLIANEEKRKLRHQQFNKVPLTPQQKSLWFEQQVSPRSTPYNIPIVLSFQSQLNAQKLNNAITALIKKYRILRTAFFEENGTPIGVVQKLVNYKVDVLEVSDEAEVKKAINKIAQTPFDLESLPLFRIVDVVNSGKSNLVIVFHHIISDGTSVDSFVYQLSKEYTKHSDFKLKKQIEPDYLDYAAWVVRKKQMMDKTNQWASKIQKYPKFLNLPTDSTRKDIINSNEGRRLNFTISNSVQKQIRNIAEEKSISEFSIYLAAYFVLLAKMSNQDKLLVGVPFANRMDIASESVLGYFVNTVALGADIDWNAKFWDFVENINDEVSEGIDNQDVSFPDLVAKLNPVRSTKYAPLVQALFVYQNTQNSDGVFESEKPVIKNISNGYVKNDLLFSLTPNTNNINGFVEYRTSIFEEATARRFLENYLAEIVNIAMGFAGLTGELKSLTPSEEQTYLNRDKLETNMSSEKSLVEKFEASTRKYTNNIAVKFKNATYSYGELDKASNRVANYLIRFGIRQGDRVGLYVDRSDKVVISILGILKTGAAYVPIDSSYPVERIEHILGDSGVRVTITEPKFKQKIDSMDKKTLDINEVMGFDRTDLPEVNIKPDDDAYIIYTSGSTGKPKGVRVSHKNVLRLISATDVDYRFHEEDVWTLFHSYAFDVSVWEIWGALSHGAKLIIVPFLVTRSSDDFYDLVKNESVTVLSQTPSAFQLFDQEDRLRKSGLSLRYVVFGGEKVEYSQLTDWFERHSQVNLINMYGITETTVHSTFHKISINEVRNTANHSNIGNPLADLRILIFDKFGNLVRDGEIGEMVIVGEGVTNGYLNRPSLNKARFIQIDNKPAFKSGDLAYRHLNSLYYVGRNDFQVKIHGFRIELGEILSNLLGFSEVKDAFVKVIDSKPLGKQIVAYIIPQTGKNFDTAKIKQVLLKSLPDYMVPNAFVEMSTFPLNVNGKVDSKKLPEPSKGGIQVSHVVKPRNAIENRVIKIWKDVLQRDDFGVTDSFFDLGGHSLLAVKIMSMLQTEFNKKLPISLLFTHKTVEQLSQVLIEDGQLNIDSVVVPLSSQSNYDNSTYIIHPGMGQVMVFSDLAKEIKHTELAAIQAPGIYGERMPFTDMNKLAEFYVEKILEKNPNRERFSIAGYCVGGSLATKVVELLEKRGKKVDNLQIIDIRPPHYQGKLSEGYIVSYFVEQLVHSFDSVDLEVKKDVKILSEQELDRKSEKQCILYLLETVRKLQIVDDNYSFEQMSDWYSTWKGIILGMNNFKLDKIKAPVTFYRAISGDYVGDEWNSYSDSVTVVDVPGDHYSILKGSSAKILAKHFDQVTNS